MSSRVGDLPLFLRDFIYDNGWTALRDIQEASLAIASGTGDNILIFSGTSSGKTEAAFFPVLSTLYEERPSGFGVLYVGPLKALIDDQYQRLLRITGDSGIRVTCWHGDADARRKLRARDDPSGILQITPESLQGLVLFHPEGIRHMFGDLRWIVIDELHSFLDSSRGLQLLCVLSAVLKIARCSPRIIGLSATISDVMSAQRWISSVNGRETVPVSSSIRGDHTIRVHYNHFPRPDSDLREDAIEHFYQELFEETDAYNCIVFTNSRLKTEMTARSLLIFSGMMGSGKRVVLHHGSLSREIRKGSEASLRSSDQRVTLVATTTLELGIDVGDVDRVVQIEPPHRASSFVQRMGRSGRRNGHPVMVMFCSEEEGQVYDSPLGICQSLIQSLALIDLYERDSWVEPVSHSLLPYGLLFQQAMVTVHAFSDVRPDSLSRYLRGLYPFRNVSEEDFEILLSDMMGRGYLEIFPDDGTLVIGKEGERFMDPQTILAVFDDDNEVRVFHGDRLIGYLPRPPPEGRKILLGGRAWTVLKMSRSRVSVKPIDSSAVTVWSSGIPEVHTKVVRRMRDILASDTDYHCLDVSASGKLANDRVTVRDIIGSTFFKSGDSVVIYPWLGTVQFDSLVRVLKRIPEVHVYDTVPMFRISVRTDMSPMELWLHIESVRRTVDPMDLVENDDPLVLEKFDRYVPTELLRKRFAVDKIDLSFELPQPYGHSLRGSVKRRGTALAGCRDFEVPSTPVRDQLNSVEGRRVI